MHKKCLFLIIIISGINYAGAETFTQDTPNVCNFVGTAYFIAEYELNEYTCNAGYYLPANHEGCVQCPSIYSCPGGTFTFDENTSQGIVYSSSVIINTNINNMCAVNLPNVLSAFYEPNSHTCNPGYYLPAGIDACTLCPAGSACVGGTYSFNENVSQGIVACEGGFSPAGSAVCCQHILHVGDDIVYLRDNKLTTPSLNIQIGNDIFYANMTTTPTYMNKDSTHYLHILYEGDDYYVCDDTTYVTPSE